MSYHEALIAPFKSFNESNDDYDCNDCHQLDADTLMFLEQNDPDITGVEMYVNSDTLSELKILTGKLEGVQLLIIHI